MNRFYCLLITIFIATHVLAQNDDNMVDAAKEAQNLRFYNK
jgi:hypothetical protein